MKKLLFILLLLPFIGYSQLETEQVKELAVRLTALEPPEIVTVTGVVLPITFPTTTLTGTPVFVPNTPVSTSATYEITDGTTVIYGKWNGTQYISTPPPNTENRRFGTTTPTILTTDKAGDWYFRTKTGTNSLSPYQKYICTGSSWYKTDGEDNFLVHPLDLAPSGICPIGATSYLDFNGGWSSTMTLPSASARKNEVFTFVHDASLSTTVLATNQYPAIAIIADANVKSITWISNGTNWVRIDNVQTSTLPISYQNQAAGVIIPVGTSGIEFKTLTTGQGFQLQRPSGTRTISVHGSTLYAAGTVFNSANESWVCSTTWGVPFAWGGQSQYDIATLTIYDTVTFETWKIDFQHGLSMQGNNIRIYKL